MEESKEQNQALHGLCRVANEKEPVEAQREKLHTSGSTGKPKEIWVEKSRMRASATMTCDFLGLRPGDTALLCLSTDYIAGRMMEVRAEVRGLRLIRRAPSSHPLKDVEEPVDLAALVPLQVYETLRVPLERERLRNIRHLLIGGGAIDPEMEVVLRDFPHHVWSTYGMTETLSHIALRPVSGENASLWYEPLPGVSVSKDENDCLVIDAPHLHPDILHTRDIVEFLDEQSGNAEHRDSRHFRILGRLDNVICSGGIKIQIEEVEGFLRTFLGHTVMVTSRPDPKFGEAVVYLSTKPIDEQLLRQAIPHPFWLPKQIVYVSSLPATQNGKPDRQRAKALAHSTPY